jgi:uncharacterized protein YkwD
MANRLNQYRIDNGKKALKLMQSLNGAACSHSQWMQANMRLSHTGKNKTSPFDRCWRAGTECYGENVAYNDYPDNQSFMYQFINSPGHNANLLNSNWDRMGIARDGIFITIKFSNT